MATVHWTPAAEEDLESIFLYVAREQRSPGVAAKIVRQIAAKACDYADEPQLAPERQEFGPGVRAFYVYRYVIFYRSMPTGIEVLRVIHGSRDVFRVFRHDEP